MTITKQMQFVIEDLKGCAPSVRNLWLFALASAARNGANHAMTDFLLLELYFLHPAAAVDLSKFMVAFMEPKATVQAVMIQLEDMLGLRPVEPEAPDTPPSIH